MGQEVLYPTLWRTCRVLANERRLEMLRVIFQNNRVCVTDIARIVYCPLNSASANLRALQARGLLGVRREANRVIYSATPDPAIPYAAGLLAVMRKVLCRPNVSLEQLCYDLTSFTHPRRLVLVGVLAENEHTCESLKEATGFSLPAIRRHLRKLVARQVVNCEEGEHISSYTLAQPKTQLTRFIVPLITDSRS